MSTEKTEAIVIRQTDFSETSRVAALFTREFGRISVMAKGARRLRGPFDAALDLLSSCHIVFIRKHSGTLDLLTEAKLIHRFRPDPRSIRSLYGGYYIAELLLGLTEEYDPHPELFDRAVETLRQLTESDDPTELILRFELTILRELGLLPPFDACEICGVPVEIDTSFVFWVSQSGLLCPQCQKDRYKQHPIQAGTLAVLRRLSDPAPSDPVQRANRRLTLTPQQHREIRRVLTAALSQTLGRRPKMLRYLFS